MAQITFNGLVSAQAQAGEAATLTITKPDGTKEPLTATTLADKTYSATKTFTVAGAYSVSIHQNADSQYDAWDAGPTAFTISLEPRTGTLKVVVQ